MFTHTGLEKSGGFKIIKEVTADELLELVVWSRSSKKLMQTSFCLVSTEY